MFDVDGLLVVSVRKDRGERGGSSLPGEHLVLDLANLLLEVLAL